jgi:hypothetical protein
MREYYGLINGIGNAKAHPLSEDYVGRMYRALQAAYQKTDDAGIRSRLDDLALYTRYVELYLNYSSAKGAARQTAYEELIRFAWRIRDTHMLHSLAIYRTGLRDKSVQIPAEAKWQVPEKDKKTGQPLNPWKQSTPFTPEEVEALVKSGIASNKLLDFEPKSFGADLVPTKQLGLGNVTATDYGALRGVQDFYMWAKQPGPFQVWGSAGFQYQSRGPAAVQFFRVEDVEAPDEGDGDDDDNDAAPIAPIPLASAEIPPDQQEHELTFNAPAAGLYRVRVSDRMMGVRLRWPAEIPVTVKSALGATTRFNSRWKLYFYVPKNTKSVGGFAYGGGLVRDADDKVIFNFPAKDGYFSIPVPPGQDGRLWSFVAANGNIGLMTVPPYLARSEKDLLLPGEVVKADTP